jgi:hypothetical protein
MGNASFDISNFLGGEISQFAQGRFDKPDYRTSLNVCFNAFPVEIGSWTRRPGSAYAGHTRRGARGRTIAFDFAQSTPVTIEFTDGFVRFRSGSSLVTTNDAQIVVAVSAANPAVVQTTAAVTWATNDTLVFPRNSTPLLENRQFTATKIDTTHFSLADAITGAAINGATLGALAAGATVAKVHELVSPYIGSLWTDIRAVQAETTDVMLSANSAPQILTIPTLPAPSINPVFALAAAIFSDGPYLDPPINGAQVTPSAKTGVITLTVAFPAYDATKAYALGAFVTSAAINYISLVDQNFNNTPAISPTQWATTSAGAAINSGKGFVATDIGRLIRLFSEPASWTLASVYALGAIVSYSPSGLPGTAVYWQSLVGGNTGHPPGSDLTNWQIVPSGAALWTWGKIVSLASFVPSAPAGVAYIGDMTVNGGLSASFNGIISKNSATSSQKDFVGLSSFNFSINSFVGEDFGASAPNSYAISSATIFPSTDLAFCAVVVTGGTITNFKSNVTVQARLFGSNSAPGANPLNGTQLGVSAVGGVTMSNSRSLNQSVGTGPVTIISSDTTTAYRYLWVVLQVIVDQLGGGVAFNISTIISQVQFLAATTSASASVAVNIEILGPALLYTTSIQTWRLGVYSNTTGWPTCGVYNDGRLYLGGAVGNRFDACVSNGITGGSVNFAPTDPFGVVTAASAISYTFNSDGVNKILWMDPDLQGIKMGTQAGEWLVQAPTAGSISPLNISARNVTKHGSSNMAPVRAEHTTMFVQRYGQKLLEYFPDVFSGKFSAPNLADKAQHITHAIMAELAYTSAVTPIVWGRDAAGGLFGITYKRDSLASAQPPTFYAWHRHGLGSGRLIESISSGPSVGGSGGGAPGMLDALTMVTNDAVSNVRHVEIMTDFADELMPLATAWFLDDAVNPTSVLSTLVPTGTAPYGSLTINGLWHLNGKTVQIFAGGLDLGDRGRGPASFTDFVVANGSVTVPYGDSISAGPGRGLFTSDFAAALPLSQIVVGFTYNSDGQLVRPVAVADTGARQGPALGELRRIHRFSMLLSNTIGLSFGTSFTNMLPVALEGPDGTSYTPLQPYSGVAQDSSQDDYSYDGMMCWRVSRPFPANVVAIAGNLATQDQ